MSRINEYTALWNVVLVMEVSGALKNEKVCVTGHLGIPRKLIYEIIVQAGGIIQEDVGRDTTILVSNQDWTSKNLLGGKKSSKMIKAEQMNKYGERVRILSEEKLCNLIITFSSTSEKSP